MIHRTDLSITHSLIFGCGGRGAGAVHHCRERIIAELFGGNDRLAGFAPLRIFAVDASDQAMNPNHKFGNGELLSVGMGDNPSIHDILDDPIYPRTGGMVKAIGSLFPPKKNYKRQLNNLANARHGMGTCPPIGRMNLLGRWNELYIYLHREIQRTWGERAPEDYEFPVVDKKTMHVFIVAGLYGGTGAGIHLDLAALTRLVFQDLRIGTPEIYGIFFLADFVPEVQHLEANTYACLKELDHFAAGKPYELFFADGTKRSVANSGADCLFNKIFLINDRNRPVDGDTTILSIDDADRMVGEVLFHWSCTDLGSQILARLRDRPNQKCQEMVSERGKGRGRS